MNTPRFATRFLLSAIALMLPLAPLSAHADPRIIGGEKVDASQFPWQVQVWGPGRYSRSLCGGVLVTSQIVLTAAHCVADVDSLAGYDLYLGRTNLFSGGQHLAITPNKYWIAPGYDPSNLSDDWALIELAEPIPDATTLPIAHAVDLADPDVAASGTVSGFGLTREGGSVSKRLRAVGLPVLPDSSCTGFGSYFVPATMLCAGTREGGKDSCGGDSGGPLRVLLADGSARLAGLVSWGYGCARVGAAGVYTRVTAAGVLAEMKAVVAEHTDLDPESLTGGATALTGEEAASVLSTDCVAATAEYSRQSLAYATAQATVATLRQRLADLRLQLVEHATQAGSVRELLGLMAALNRQLSAQRAELKSLKKAASAAAGQKQDACT